VLATGAIAREAVLAPTCLQTPFQTPPSAALGSRSCWALAAHPGGHSRSQARAHWRPTIRAHYRTSGHG